MAQQAGQLRAPEFYGPEHLGVPHMPQVHPGDLTAVPKTRWNLTSREAISAGDPANARPDRPVVGLQPRPVGASSAGG